MFDLYAACFLSAKHPSLPSAPKINANLSGSNIYLKCSFEARNENSSLGFVVTWSRMSPDSRKEELKQETTVQTFSYIELDGINLRLGDKVLFDRFITLVNSSDSEK